MSPTMSDSYFHVTTQLSFLMIILFQGQSSLQTLGLEQLFFFKANDYCWLNFERIVLPGFAVGIQFIASRNPTNVQSQHSTVNMLL